LYYRALTKYALEDDKGVVEDCTSALAINKSYDTYYQRGISKYMLKDYVGAIDDFNESLKLKPDYKLALLERGVTYYQTEKDALAMADLNKSIELNPKSDRAFLFRGKLKKYMNDLPGSCADLKQAKSLGNTMAQEELTKNGCK
jgi:tetratricopeptide (TPR) repeat protein